jgi:glycolate oxidase iron-sulfur subunit
VHAQPSASLADTTLATEAVELLRRCVHCGFCLPACPTYRVTGNELDSPRGRIYLIKELVERGGAAPATRTHLDRCLTCRACESACPSGVEYGRLVDVGRELVELRPPAPRGPAERLLRFALVTVASRRRLFTPLVRLAQGLRPWLPAGLRGRVPPRAKASADAPAVRTHESAVRPARRLAVLEGCVQPGLAPQINEAATRVLARLGVTMTAARQVGCCGALPHHLGHLDAAAALARRNVAACAQLLDQGVEAIVSTASGCGVHAKDYAHLLRRAEPAVVAAAARVAAATCDLSEVIEPAELRRALDANTRDPGERDADTARAPRHGMRVAWQAPCTLQHGQRAATAGRVEALLEAAGYELVPVRNSTLCCGSAGTYSLLQPVLANELQARKLDTLIAGRPDVIATANVGCLEHLRQASPVPVRHWIELVDDAFSRR